MSERVALESFGNLQSERRARSFWCILLALNTLGSMVHARLATTAESQKGGATAHLILAVGFLEPLVADLAIELAQFAEIRETRSASAAAVQVGQRVPSLLVLSQSILSSDDWPALREIANKAALPLILVVQDEASGSLALQIGAEDYFVAPLDPRIVATRLKSLLECLAPRRHKLSLHEARWRFAFEGASLGVWELDLKTRTVGFSAALCETLGLDTTKGQLTEREWLTWTHPQDQVRVSQARRRLSDGLEQEIRLEYRIVSQDARVVWVREIARVIEKERRAARRLMGVVSDTTQQRASERRLVQLANFDLLTELPNRKKCREFLLEAVERAQSTGDAACLIRIDISGLASINQRSGRPAGDLVLRQMANRLRDLASDPEKVCRLGGKEFAFIVEQLERPSGLARAAEIAANVARAIAEPLDVLGESTSYPAHIGVCVFPESGSDPEELLRKADIALADASHDRIPFAVFRKSMLRRVEAQHRLLKDLQRAVFCDEIELAYQPIVDGSGKLVAVEALARWQHPTRGRIPAADFIPLAIESGLIVPLGAALRRSACEQLVLWQRDSSTSELAISLNVSPVEFETESFASDLLLLVESMHVDPRKLQLELSESLLQGDPNRLRERMRALNDAGIRLALGDFGTGYSSLKLLKELPFAHLKLDRSFVSEILTDAVDASLSRAILAMAQNLGLEVTAEGVEEEAQAKLLVEMGCTRFQGYLFGRATDSQTIETRVSEESSPLSVGVFSMSAPPSRTLDDETDARILIVDDDPTTLQLLSRILREYPNVRTTTSPLKALKMVEERAPDLLLLDTQMPELNGFELWDALRANPEFSDIPAVFVTALLDPETEIKALSMGAVDFVSKPISAARLKIAVRNQVRIKRQTDSLRQQASMDALTGVANRRSFDRALEREWARAQEGKSPLSLLMVDVDHFKSINDNFGHLAGDQCLISVARILAHLVRRPVDLVARYGGEEFAVILPLAAEEQAAATAAEIVSEVSSTNFREDLTADHHVTVSVGWTTAHGADPSTATLSVAGMIQQADEALLSAKEQGRNRVCGPEALSQRMKRASNR